MDSREQPLPQQQHQPQPNMMVAPAAYPPMLAPATAQFPFNNNPALSHPLPPPEPLLNHEATSEVLQPLQPCAASESSKKKRGRPRKYSPDRNMALSLTPVPDASSAAELPPKKHRGRPLGSGKKSMDPFGVPGTGFMPHVIIAEAGEDIAAKLSAFCEQGPRTVCTFSANGAVRDVTIRAPALPAGTVFYEGQFDILSLKAATLISENNSSQKRMSALNVSLAGPKGQVVGGKVVGALTAATAVQIVLGSFIADGKKSSSSNPKSGRVSTPSSQGQLPTTPTSQGPSTESSEDNENSHFSKGPGGPGGLGGPGLYNDASQAIHNMSMYHLWAGQPQ